MTHGDVFEVYTIVAEIDDGMDLVFVFKNMAETEGRLNTRTGEYDFIGSARSFCSHLGGVLFVSWFLLLFLQLCQRSVLLWLCISVLRLLGNVVRVYPRIVQGLTFLSA